MSPEDGNGKTGVLDPPGAVKTEIPGQQTAATPQAAKPGTPAASPQAKKFFSKETGRKVWDGVKLGGGIYLGACVGNFIFRMIKGVQPLSAAKQAFGMGSLEV